MKFQDKVLALTKKVPKGKVTTYKELAKAMKTKAYRAVGTSLRKNNKPIIIPCHRVISSDGSLGGYQGKINNKKKETLLKKEGIKINKGKINLNKYLFKL